MVAIRVGGVVEPDGAEIIHPDLHDPLRDAQGATLGDRRGCSILGHQEWPWWLGEREATADQLLGMCECFRPS
jgi:hypothetical protein